MFNGCAIRADEHSVMPTPEVKHRRDRDQRQADGNPFLQYADLNQKARFLISLGNRIALVNPIRSEVVRNVENLHVSETQGA